MIADKSFTLNEIIAVSAQDSSMSAVQLISRLLRLAENPDMTAEEVTASIYELTTCRHCHREIRSSRYAADPVWFHADEAKSRGCRAASFNSETGWDESLDRSWKARPSKEYRGQDAQRGC